MNHHPFQILQLAVPWVHILILNVMKRFWWSLVGILFQQYHRFVLKQLARWLQTPSLPVFPHLVSFPFPPLISMWMVPLFDLSWNIRWSKQFTLKNWQPLSTIYLVANDSISNQLCLLNLLKLKPSVYLWIAFLGRPRSWGTRIRLLINNLKVLQSSLLH